MVRNSASATHYHLHGVSTFTVKIKRYACVCATTSDVCEAALQEVSQGSQLAGRTKKIDDAVRYEVGVLTELLSATWVAFAVCW